MGLKQRKHIDNVQRKYINNVHELPGFELGTSETGSAVTGAATLGGSIYNDHQFNETYQDYINKYGTSNRYFGDVGYTHYNDINKNAELDAVGQQNTANLIKTTTAGAGLGAASGAMIGVALGSAVPIAGTLIGAGIGALGGLVGSWLGGKHRKSKAREQLAEAQQRVNNYNEMNRADAQTSQLQLAQAEKIGDTRSQQLFAAKDGKDELIDPIRMETIDDHVVETTDGPVIDKQNSWLSKDEGVWNPSTGTAHLVTHGPNDTARANLKSDDVVFGGLTNPVTGNMFKYDAAPLIAMKERMNKMKPNGSGWLSEQTKKTWETVAKPINDKLTQELNDLAMIQRYVPSRRKNGTLPGYEDKKDSGNAKTYGLTWGSNFIPTMAGLAGSAYQFINAAKDQPYAPDTYVPNRFANKGLALLSSLRINPYGTLQELRNAEARTNSAIIQSGGLNTAQKNLSRLIGLHGTQQQIANSLNAIQAQNNSYFSQYANALLQQGLGEAQRQEAAKKWDLEYYSKAHANKQQQMLTGGIYNAVNTLGQYTANEYERKSGIANLDLYRQNNETQRAMIEAWLSANKPQTSVPKTAGQSWQGGIPLVLAPEILDAIPGAFPPQQTSFVPGPSNWQNNKPLWNNDLIKQYGR